MGGSEYGWSRYNDMGIFRDYDAEADRLIESAKPWDLKCIKLDNDFIFNSPYYLEHKDVLDQVSFGFCYKVIGFSEILKTADEEDILLFIDSNHIIQEDPSVFYDLANEFNICCRDHIFDNKPNWQWTRRDTFINMNCDESRYWNSLQMQCNIIGIKKCEFSMKFVNEWLKCSLDYKIMFGENKYPNFDGFKEHRHDQSIFSILREKHQIPYINRTHSKSMESIIPEKKCIIAENPVDNSFRKEQDRKENK